MSQLTLFDAGCKPPVKPTPAEPFSVWDRFLPKNEDVFTPEELNQIEIRQARILAVKAKAEQERKSDHEDRRTGKGKKSHRRRPGR